MDYATIRLLVAQGREKGITGSLRATLHILRKMRETPNMTVPTDYDFIELVNHRVFW